MIFMHATGRELMTFRTYIGNRMATGDYQRLHDFLVETKNTEYTYARFDWMMTNWDYLEDRYLDRIGIWEEEGKVVGAVLFDHSLDILFPMVLPGYENLHCLHPQHRCGNCIPGRTEGCFPGGRDQH